ncbi:PREDICTED: transcription factor bHLH111 [Tarenaya hassleriana]|uniref:transcription factor bHLH111 n=1 Tax=Tarenaya hassleriana TaxID=28532 RepID=UPI00053C94EB|nr:PREDICTED: transcription factor bHLH111 [Tarenaya hassleriana]
MREECTVNSAAAAGAQGSSWWDVQNHHANSFSSLYNNRKNSGNNLNSSCEDDLSITNASNHSGLTAESSHRCLVSADQSASSDELLREHVSSHNHLWSHALLHGGNSVDMHESNGNLGEQMIDHFTSKKPSAPTSFEPPCDNYPKKMDSNGNFWNYSNQIRYGLDDQDQSLVQSHRLSKFSNLVGNWSIAPPNPDMNHHHLDSQTSDNVSLCSTLAHHYKQNLDDMGSYSEHDLRIKSEDFCFNQLGPPSNIGYHNCHGGESGYINGFPHSPCESSRSFLDIRLTRTLSDIDPSFKPCLKSLSLSKFKKKELQTTSMTSGTSGMTIEGKNKRCMEVSDEVSKKAKNGSSATSPAKEVPKAKVRDKITSLQQIVSPFGKTDTASVLQEAITYIKFLQEQVKLLSTPYMKNSLKDPWGGWEREDNSKGDAKYLDLRSKGLCLVPVSFTPRSYRESTGADYWSPTYRGCLYR